MHNMRKKQQFVRPAVLQEMTFLPDCPILAGSGADNMTVYSTGQQVDNYNFGPNNTDGFNHEWE